mmetsp:Transcript_5621/g.34860  ORF Transcript_5621/g.34860 Transcript_5621/m.34860 type:complete len:80 (+) Transcript_5621:1992-2231(+)
MQLVCLAQIQLQLYVTSLNQFLEVRGKGTCMVWPSCATKDGLVQTCLPFDADLEHVGPRNPFGSQRPSLNLNKSSWTGS